MDWITIFGIAIALAMDAFAVALAAGAVLSRLLGHRLGRAWGKRVEVCGGLILLGIGFKILCDHTARG